MDCPRCHKEVPLEKTSKIICPRCKREFINEDIDVAFGVKRMVVVKGGVEVTAYELIGDACFKFPSWYCLKFFESYDKMEEHNKKYHKLGDFMIGCIPSGFPEGMKTECGD